MVGDVNQKVTRLSVELMEYVLHNEDCLKTSKGLPKESIDLIYADPPFLSGRIFDFNNCKFDDRWTGYQEYIDWIRPRLAI